MNRYAKILLLCISFASIPLIMAPRNGSGTYQLPAGNPVVSGTVISSTTHNTTMSDVATALTGSLAKDGQTTPTANLPMGGFRHTGVGNPTLRNQYGTVDNIQDGDYLTVTSVAGTNTVTGSMAPSISAYVAGMKVVLIPANANSGATTLNLNSVGALDVQKYTSAGQVALAANDLRAGIPALLVLDTGGDDWILLNPYSGSLGDVTIGVLTATTINASGTVTGGNVSTSGTVTGANLVGAYAATGLTGTIADARLSSNVPLLNASNTFTGITQLHSASGATIGINDTGGSSGKKRGNVTHVADSLQINVCTDGGGSCSTAIQIGHSGATVDSVALSGTSITAGSSRINTIANSGRTAFGTVSSAGSLSNSLNVTSSSKPGTGLYTINVTAAGFSAAPSCIATQDSAGLTLGPNMNGITSTSVGVSTFNIGGTATDQKFHFVCYGP